MSANTIAINQSMTEFNALEKLWLFGYGSLIYKIDFPYIERRPAHINHWSRRFWQGSHDHRGTPEKPGRVVTLVAAQGETCEGVAYLIAPEVFNHLDFREKNGYLRIITDIHFRDGKSEQGVVYIANKDNSAYLGPASERDIALQIAQSVGPSGKNSDYLLQLALALRELGEEDAHVFTIEQYLHELEAD